MPISAVAIPGTATFIGRYPLLTFFGLAYGGAWLVWAPWVLSQYGVGLFHVGSAAIQVLPYVGAFAGPSLAAFTITWRLAGKEGVRVLCRRYLLWRVGLRWYLVALVLIPAFVSLGILTLPGAAPSYTGEPPLQITAAFLTRLVLFGIIGGPLAEEPGWRGFALPLLQDRYGPLKGSLLLGTVWAFWHLPLFLTASEGGGRGVAPADVILLFAQFAPATVAFTLVLTWLFNRTNRSLLTAILAHAALNASTVLLKHFQLTSSRTPTCPSSSASVPSASLCWPLPEVASEPAFIGIECALRDEGSPMPVVVLTVVLTSRRRGATDELMKKWSPRNICSWNNPVVWRDHSSRSSRGTSSSQRPPKTETGQGSGTCGRNT